MRALGYVTACWGVVMALSPLLQVRRMFVTRSSESVSVGYFSLLCIGFTLWVAYGISEHNLVLIVPNSASWLVGTSTIVIARRFGRGRAHEAAEAG